jgi:two-component system, OmpR family, heavy metal sensor histidine kinase CusS
VPLSRLRLRLSAWFALAFLAGLTALSVTLFAYLRHQSSLRLTRSLRTSAVELADAVRFELWEAPSAGLPHAAREALVEWPPHQGTFVVYGADGVRLGERGDSMALRRLPSVLAQGDTLTADILELEGFPLRQVTVSSQGAPRFFVRGAGSTRIIHDESGTLALWLGLAPPLVLALSLVGGYLLSHRALTPIEQLGRDVAALAPSELDHRLPVGQPRDEIDDLAVQFNGLLERLQRVAHQNSRFVQQAAHQIRTPLTLVLGEAGLALERPRTPTEQRQALERILAAAGQMKRRVDELMLLAQAEAGDRPTMDESVELDGLVLECADLMRARAQGLGQRLELLQVDDVSVRGNEALLKEALLELIENACRYGGTGRPISISALRADGSAHLRVGSLHRPVAGAGSNGQASGLGLTIVRWIASEHGGTLVQSQEDEGDVYQLVLPAL